MLCYRNCSETVIEGGVWFTAYGARGCGRQACTYKPGATLNGVLSRISTVCCLIWYQYESTVLCLIIMSVIGALICFAHLYNALYNLAVSGGLGLAVFHSSHGFVS